MTYTAINSISSELTHVYYNEMGNLGMLTPLAMTSPVGA
jgi:hypothetical protein